MNIEIFSSKFAVFRTMWRDSSVEKRPSMLASMVKRAMDIASEKESSGEHDFAFSVVKLVCDFLRLESSVEFPAESGRLMAAVAGRFPETAMKAMTSEPHRAESARKTLPKNGFSPEEFLAHLNPGADNAKSCSTYLAELVAKGRADPETARMLVKFALVDCICREHACMKDSVVCNFFDLNGPVDKETMRFVLRAYEENSEGEATAFLVREARLPENIRAMAVDALCRMERGAFLAGAGYVVGGASCRVKDGTTREHGIAVFDRLLEIVNDDSSKTRELSGKAKGRLAPRGLSSISEHKAAMDILATGLGYGATKLDASAATHIWKNLRAEERERLCKQPDVVRNILACAPELLPKDVLESAVGGILASRDKDSFVRTALNRVEADAPFLAVCSALCSGGKKPLSPDKNTAERLLNVVSSVLSKAEGDEEAVGVVRKFFTDCVERKGAKERAWPKNIVEEMRNRLASAMAALEPDVEDADSEFPVPVL